MAQMFEQPVDIIRPGPEFSGPRFRTQPCVSVLIGQQFFYPSRESVRTRLIDNQTSAAAGDFSERAVVAANARLAVQKTFRNGKSIAFHQGGINGEPAIAILAQQCFVIDMPQPPERATAPLQVPNLPHGFVQRRPGASSDEMQFK